MTAQDDAGQALYQRIGLIAGPIAALILFLTFEPEGLSRAGVIVAALGLWMAIWWATEAIPVAVTAFLPLVVLPLLDVVPMRAHTVGAFIGAGYENVSRMRSELGVDMIVGDDCRCYVYGTTEAVAAGAGTSAAELAAASVAAFSASSFSMSATWAIA